MIALSAAEIAAIVGGALTGPAIADPASAASSSTGPVVIDSREAAPGALFAALPGERVDGHDFAAVAVKAGAVAVLSYRPIPDVAGVPVIVTADVTVALGALAREVLRRLPSATVIGITGSSGKTSTKDLTAQVVDRLGATIAPVGSFNNELGLPLTVLRADGRPGTWCWRCPPAASATSPSCATSRRRGSARCSTSAGPTPASSARSTRSPRPRASWSRRCRPTGSRSSTPTTPTCAAMAARTRARISRFSASAARTADRQAEVRAAAISLDDRGRASFRMIAAGGSADVHLRLHGGHHVSNALAAAAIAAELGLDVPAIADALSHATARSKKRMELHERADGVLVVNDAYNANPDSTRAAIEALRHLTSTGRRGFAVLGYMAELGDFAEESHQEAGRLAALAGVAGLVAVGELAAPLLDGARRELGWRGEAIAVPDAPGGGRGAAKPIAPRRRRTSEGIQVGRPVGSGGRPARGG